MNPPEAATSPQQLGRRAASGISWQMLAGVVRALASFGFGIVLARLLPPEDFGVISIAYMATGFVYVLTEMGFGQALIQREAITERHVRVCYTASVALAAIMAIAIFGAAGPIAAFFNDMRVAPVLRVMSVTALLSGLTSTASALLLRRLEFEKTVKIEVVASILGYGGVAVAMAVAGFGYWSLVGGTVAQAALASGLTFRAQRHSLRPLLARAEFNDLVGYSTGMSLISFVNFFALKGDYLAVGRLMNATSLGFYSRAYTLMELPLVFFGSALSRVLFPAAAQVQDEPERFRRAYLTTISMSVAASVPVSLAVVILAPEVILTLYGAQWAPTIPVLQILGLFGMFRMTYNTASAFVRARGLAYPLLISTIVYGGLVVAGSWWAASTGGIQGVAWAVGGAITTMWLLVIGLANRVAVVSARQFAKEFALAAAPGVVIAAGLFGLVAALRFIHTPPFALLAIAGFPFGIAMMASLVYQAHRFDHSAINALLARVLAAVPLLRRFGSIQGSGAPEG